MCISLGCIERLVGHGLQQSDHHGGDHQGVEQPPVQGQHEEDDQDVEDPEGELLVDSLMCQRAVHLTGGEIGVLPLGQGGGRLGWW